MGAVMRMLSEAELRGRSEERGYCDGEDATVDFHLRGKVMICD
jgi:hypothetical protein